MASFRIGPQVCFHLLESEGGGSDGGGAAEGEEQQGGTAEAGDQVPEMGKGQRLSTSMNKHIIFMPCVC